MKFYSMLLFIAGLAATSRAESLVETGVVECAYQQTIKYDYVVKLPAGYGATTQAWPLLLNLHGSSGRDIGPSLDSLRKRAEEFSQPMIFVQPQWKIQPKDEPRFHYWNPEAIVRLLRDVSAKYRVDRDRVYLTGGSMGGGATWEIAAQYPHLFAAIAPMCGWPGNRLDNLRYVPVWAFHGGKDDVVDPAYQQFAVELLNKHGGNAKLTIYPEVGHGCGELAWSNPQLFTWFLSHTRQCRAKDEFVTKTGTCTLTATPPVIDGNLGDRVWQTAETLTGFMDPRGPAVAEQTQVRLLADQTNLYVSVLAYEPNIAGITCRKTEHDSAVWNDDSFEIFLKPSNDHKTYYQIAINPSGTVFYAKCRDAKWDAVGLQVKTGKREDAWTVEVVIPWAALDHTPAPQVRQTIHVLFARNRPLPNFNATSQWPPVNGSNHSPEHFAEITFRTE